MTRNNQHRALATLPSAVGAVITNVHGSIIADPPDLPPKVSATVRSAGNRLYLALDRYNAAQAALGDYRVSCASQLGPCPGSADPANVALLAYATACRKIGNLPALTNEIEESAVLYLRAAAALMTLKPRSTGDVQAIMRFLDAYWPSANAVAYSHIADWLAGKNLLPGVTSNWRLYERRRTAWAAKTPAQRLEAQQRHLRAVVRTVLTLPTRKLPKRGRR